MKDFCVTAGKDTLMSIHHSPEVTSIALSGEEVDVSDGYHTMRELYQHRMALNIALFNTIEKLRLSNLRISYAAGQIRDVDKIQIYKSKLHNDGGMFEGYFIVMLIDPIAGQISYHYELKHWDKFKIKEVERTPPWDGHGAPDVVERLMKL